MADGWPAGEKRGAGCHGCAPRPPVGETAREPTADRRRRHGCRPAAARPDRSSPPGRIVAS